MDFFLKKNINDCLPAQKENDKMADIGFLLKNPTFFDTILVNETNQILRHEGDFHYFMKNKAKSTPNAFFYWTMFYPIQLLSRMRKKVIIKNHVEQEISGPTLILANHVSFWDFAFIVQAFRRHRLTVISNRYYFRPKQLRFLLEKLKAIPKSIMHSDLETIKRTFQAIKDKQQVLMFPEGRLSTDGTNLNIVHGTGALIKKLHVPLVFVEISGGYLTTPKWAKYTRRGTIEVDIKKYCPTSMYESLSAEEIDRFVSENIHHNEYEYAQRSGNTYHCIDRTKGLDGILYHCPKCHEEFTLHAEKDHIVCDKCGFDAELKEDYTFISELPEIHTIHDWNEMQISLERMRYQNQNIDLKIPVIVKKMNMLNPKLDKTGEGVVRIDKAGYFFDGTINQEKEEIFIAKDCLEGIPFSSNEEFEFYHNKDLYYFYPRENPAVCAKVSIIADVIRENLGENYAK